MSLAEQSIYRVYKCDNDDCASVVGYNETIGDPWRKECPFCLEQSLYLDSAITKLTTVMELNQPKTIGTLGERNYEKALKEGKKIFGEKPKKPFYRSKDKVNFDILKNPNKYISEGRI
jgi:hypothetical protein